MLVILYSALVAKVILPVVQGDTEEQIPEGYDMIRGIGVFRDPDLFVAFRVCYNVPKSGGDIRRHAIVRMALQGQLLAVCGYLHWRVPVKDALWRQCERTQQRSQLCLITFQGGIKRSSHFYGLRLGGGDGRHGGVVAVRFVLLEMVVGGPVPRSSKIARFYFSQFERLSW